MQLPVSAHLPRRLCRRLVVLGQELIVILGGQDAQDLDRVVLVRLVHGLRAHTSAGYQRGTRASPGSVQAIRRIGQLLPPQKPRKSGRSEERRVGKECRSRW